MALRSRLKDGVLRLEIPIQEPRPSGSGKTLVVASTHGLVNTGIEHRGSEIIVNANAFIENRKRSSKKTKRKEPSNSHAAKQIHPGTDNRKESQI
jgi:hypothetical protein